MERECLYHICIWSRDGKSLFPEKRKDRERFLKLLKKARMSGELRVYAYCFLRDRLQFLCSCPYGVIDKILASVEGVYRNYCHTKYRDKSPVWEHAADECGWEGLIDMVRYVHRSPIRDEKRGLKYRWSSHREYLAGDDRWVDYAEALAVYGKRDRMTLKRYKGFMRNTATERPASFFYLTEAERQAADRSCPAASPRKDAGAATWEPQEPAADAGTSGASYADDADDPAAFDEAVMEEEGISPETVIAVTAELMGVTCASMQKSGGVPQETAARRVALYVMKEKSHLSNAEIGRALGLSATTVSRTYNNAALREELFSRVSRVKLALQGQTGAKGGAGGCACGGAPPAGSGEAQTSGARPSIDTGRADDRDLFRRLK